MSTEQVLGSLVKRLEQAVSRLEGVQCIGSATPGNNAGGSEADIPASIAAFDEITNEYLPLFYEKSKVIGGLVQEQAQLFKQMLSEHRKVILVASKSKKALDKLGQIAKAQVELCAKIGELASKNRQSPLFNNLSTISEGLGAFGWISVEPTPVPFIHEMIGASEFYSNKLLRTFKDSDKDQVAWVTSFNKFIRALEAYVKKFHTTSLTWNPNGGDALKVLESLGGDQVQEASTEPAPQVMTASASNEGSNTNKLFSDINKGSGVTSGLRKVTDDMKVKNRSDRVGLVGESQSQSKPKAAPAKTAVHHAPKTELQSNSWVIEHHTGGAVINIDVTEMRQVARIYKCDGATIRINGKLNAINIDSCRKTNVVFDEAVSVVELINCSGSVNVQVLVKVPSITIDKTSGASIILGKDSLDTQVITSKSDSINISIPSDDENQFKEFPVPEQYINRIRNGALVSECNTHLGD